MTTQLSDHYNLKVLADVRFWLSYLETQKGIIEIDEGGGSQVTIDTRLIGHEGYSAEAQDRLTCP